MGVLLVLCDPNSGSQRFIPMFLSVGFIALGFTIRSVIHFELIFAYACDWIFSVAVLPLVNSALIPELRKNSGNFKNECINLILER